jgi:hypothetical protein
VLAVTAALPALLPAISQDSAAASEGLGAATLLILCSVFVLDGPPPLRPVVTLHGVLRSAAAVFPTPKFAEIRLKAISQELSWNKPAKKWEAVLEELADGSVAAKVAKESVATPVQNVDNPEVRAR